MDQKTRNDAEILEAGHSVPRGFRLGGANGHRAGGAPNLPDVFIGAAIALAAVIAITQGQLGRSASSTVTKSSGRQHRPGVVLRIDSLSGAPSDWQLLALSGQSEVQVDLAAGSLSVNPLIPPPVELTTIGRNHVRPLLVDETGVSGGAVMTDRAIVSLQGAASTSPTVLRGPEPNDVWVAGPGHQMRLLGVDARPTGMFIDLPRNVPFSAVRPDGSGFLLVTSADGTYETRPGLRRLVTRGRILAIGPTGWLVRECHARACRVVLVGRAEGVRKVLSIPAPHGIGTGLIAPDGRDVALHARTRSGAPDVVTERVGLGPATVVGIVPAGEQGDDPGAWSPDGRYLFVSEADGGLAVQDTRLDTTRQLARFPQPLVDLALRSSSPTTFDNVLDDRPRSTLPVSRGGGRIPW